MGEAAKANDDHYYGILVTPWPLVGSERRADVLLRQTGDVSGQVVVVNFDRVHYASDVFLERLFRGLLDGGAEVVEVTGLVPERQAQIEAVAARMGTDRVRPVHYSHVFGLRRAPVR